MQWIARRLARWIAPFVREEINQVPLNCQIFDLKEATLHAVDKAIVARQMIEEFANHLGYELTHEGDAVVVTPLKKD